MTNFPPLSHDAATDAFDVSVVSLAVSLPHMVRPIDRAAVYQLAATDPNEWEPIVIRDWPDSWEKPSPEVRYHVINGTHLLYAAQVKGLHTLRARLVDLPDDASAKLVAIASNTVHREIMAEEITEEEVTRLLRRLQDGY